MTTYNVLVMRPAEMADISSDFRTLQWRQYFATGIEADSDIEAGKLAIKEVQRCDRRDLKDLLDGEPLPNGYTVLGHIEKGGEYTPWLNGTFR